MSKWPTIVNPYARISRTGWIEDSNGCWNWKGGKNSKGYGVLPSLKKDTGTYLVHRAMYIIKNGKPSGEVMHSCDNRGCINPDHLSDGTHSENMLDMSKKMRMPNPKLNPKKVIEIRAKLNSGTNQELADEYGVSRAIISKLRRNVIWKWVTEDMEEVYE